MCGALALGRAPSDGRPFGSGSAKLASEPDRDRAEKLARVEAEAKEALKNRHSKSGKRGKDKS